MRTFSGLALFCALGFVAVTGDATAFDESKPGATAAKPLSLFKNPQQALNLYIERRRSGDAGSSLDALRYAADGGEPLARWKLGAMYAAGDGVPRDDRAAYNYFMQIVDAYDEADPEPRERGVVAAAFVAVGAYALQGVPGAAQKDAARAQALFSYAATEFGDPNAQYNLGRMYLDGAAGQKDARRGARWLRLAADKSHLESQALLGHLYFGGADGFPRQPALGLMYLTLARESAGERADAKWILDLYDAAFAVAADQDKTASAAYVAQYRKAGPAGEAFAAVP